MRPSHSDEAVVADAVVTSTSFWFTAIGQQFQGIWVEVLIVMLALYIYMWQTKQSTWRWRSTKPSADGSKKQLAKKPASSHGPKATCQPSMGDEAKQVQKLVVSLLSKHRTYGADALIAQYDELMKSCGNLRSHIPDDMNARSMYLGLFQCVAALPATAAAPMVRGRRNIDIKASLVQQWATSLLSDMQVQGFPRNMDFYQSVLRLLTSCQHFREALCLYDYIVEDGVQANSTLVTTLLNAAISAGESERALFFFEEVAKCSVPSLRSIMMVLRVHSANKDWQGAVKLLDRMESMGAQPDNIVLNNVLGLCVAAGEPDAAQLLLQRWKSITDVVSCNILLKGYSQQADLVKADSVLQDMIANGPEPNLISHNTVMDCAVRCMQIQSADKPVKNSGRDYSYEVGSKSLDGASFAAIAQRPWELLDQLLARGLEPDRYTCSTLVKGMHLTGCSIPQIDRAVELLNRIGAAALKSPGAGSTGSTVCNARLLEVLFNTLLDACITVRDLDRMTNIFAMMQEFQVSISAVTYGTLIKAFGQALRLPRCHEVWEDMQRAHIQPTIVTYGCYIDACIRNEEADRAEEIFESMSQGPHAVQPNAVIYTSLIRGFTNAKMPLKAIAFYRRMREERIEATSVTFNSVLDVVARQSDAAMLQEILDDMSKAGATPDAVTYSILTKASCNAGNVNNALAVFRQMHSNGLIFDTVACNSLLLACSKADQVSDAEEVFAEMLSVGMVPTHVTISIMVKMFGKAKLLDKAVAVAELQEREYGQKPNLFVYTCLIQACVQNKQVRRSWDIFNQMITSGVEPDAVTYGTVIHGLVYLNKFQYAMVLIRHAYQLPQSTDTDPDCPFVFASPLRRAVPLQTEVLQMLLAALKRKEQGSLVSELEEILAKREVAPNDTSKPQGGKSNRRTRTTNPDA